MPNVVLPNLTPYSINHSFGLMWSMTRAMMKAGYTYLKSSNGTTIDTTGNPDNDKWGAPTSTGNTGAAATLSSKTLDDITVTGLTGMSTSSVGRFLTLSGCTTSANNGCWQIVAYVSATSVKIRNASGSAGDASNGAITWTEKDHTTTAYSTVQATLDGVACWWLCQGPSLLKVPINANPSPAFKRGEKVTQAVSLAEGEVIGVAYNTSSDSYMVIQPRIGTFNSSNVITGAVSGATATPSATVITFVCEIVIAKTTDIFNGWIFYQRVDASSESAQRFSNLVPTATVAPGNGTTTNAFPTYAFAPKGNVNSSSQAWLQGVTGTGSTMMSGRGQIIVANAIGNADTSPDGTFWVVQAMPGHSSESFSGFGFSRMDDTEEGDVDPYTWVVCNTSQTRTGSSTSSNYMWGVTGTSGQQFWSSSPYTHLGWRRRGFGGTGDAFGTSLYPSFLYQVARGQVMSYNQGDPDRVACSPATLNHREAVWVIGCEQSTRIRKGTHRWLYNIGQGAPLNVWDSRTWLQVIQAIPSLNGGVVIGPWDGATDPIYV
jgi:hypothetical protein